MLHPLLIGALVVLATMTGVWLLSIRLRNVAIIDIAWGSGIAALAWVYATQATDLPSSLEPRTTLMLAFVSLWGFRLSAYLFRRAYGAPEDARYRAMRDRWGERFWWVSYVTVFLLQAALQWLVALPFYSIAASPGPASAVPTDAIGAVLFLLGFLLEAVADFQLTVFKRDPSHRGHVLDRGLWRYSRHPNYFGETLLWWGLGIIAAGAAGKAWPLVSPVLITALLLRVSGVTLLEATLGDRPAYRDYMRRTSAFVPWFPRKN